MSRPGADGLDPATLVEALGRSAGGASANRGYSFLADGDEVTARLGFEHLDRRARAIGSGLARFARPGDRAVLVFPPGLEFVEALFGCFAGRVVAVPAPWQRPGRANPQLGAIAEDSGATLALTTRAVLAMRDRFVAAEPRLGPLRWLAVEDFEGCGDEAPPPGPDDLAMLQYTSGSTGSPKGVMLPHRALVANVEAMRRVLGLAPEKPGVCWLPPFHDMGLIGNILQVAYTGMDLVMMPPAAFVQSPIRWPRAIARFAAYVSGGPNFAFDLCARTIRPGDLEGLDLGSWEVAYVGAEPVAPRTLDRFAAAFAPVGFRRSAFYPCFGLAESTLMVTGGDRSAAPIVRRVRRDDLARGRAVEASPGDPDADTQAFAGCGRAMAGVDLRVVDPTAGDPVEAGHVGEIWAAGPSVGLGYWGRPEESDRIFRARLAHGDDKDAGPAFLRTGDSGFLDEVGELFVSGRLKDVIIIRGRNHFPPDIEAVADSAHPALKPGAVVAFGVELDGETRLELVAEVARHTPAEEFEAIVGLIRRAVAAETGLDAHAVTLARASSLPRTSSGKARRLECKRMALAGEIDAVHRGQAPASGEENAGVPLKTRREVRDWLVDRIARHLGTTGEAIGTAEPFASFGLDSVSMVTISAELGDRLGSNLSPTLLYDAPTIDALADAVAGDSSSPRSPGEGPGVRVVERRAAPAQAGFSPVGWVETQRAVGELGPDPAYGESRSDQVQVAGDATPLTPGPSPGERGETDPPDGAIAIVGAGCRFPGAGSLDEFWDLLRDGRDAVGTLPEARRWSSPRGPIASEAGGFLAEVDRFDAAFFGISPREAAFVDPQHRLLLEVAWEALEDAGIAADTLAGRPVGVFAGVGNGDYGRRLAEGSWLDDAYWATGNAPSMAAARVSYHLDLTGPSLTVDTACSSSLVAVHLAVQSLRRGECDLALAAGVNLILAPEVSVSLTRARMLSPSGRCRAFDAGADGYARGEGCGVAVLKPLAHALRDGDRVLAVIRGSAINQDGKSNGITAPNASSQAALIRAGLGDAGAAAGQIGCVEAHGSGTILGDPIEFDALKAALSEGPTPCAISTVKTNLGHLEAAAGIAGLLKAALQLDRGVIARHLHHESTNPHIHLEGTRFFIPDATQPWPVPRMAGVSSFGFGGTNAHVVLEAPPKPAPSGPSRPGHLLAISARSPEALRELAGRYINTLTDRLTPAEAADLCHTAAIGRVHFAHRLAVRAETAGGLRDALAAFLDGRRADGLHPGQARRDASSRVGFLFTGQGAQHEGMGRLLFATCPPFRSAIARCDEALKAIGEPAVSPALGGSGDGEPGPQVALFALEYALAETWRSWGVVPVAVLGHSLGEYAAACLAGVFDLPDALRLVATRGRLMAGLCPPGAMAAVFAPPEVVAEEVRPRADSLSIAAINGPANVVISGSTGSVAEAVEAFRRRGFASQPLDVSLAFHSPLIEPALGPFAEVAATIPFQAPSIPLVSNLSGRPAGDEVRDPAYWCRHAREPVRFLDGVRQLGAMGVDTFVEVGPSATLSALAQGGISPAGSPAFVPSLRKGRDDWRTLLDAVGTLYARGVAIDWRGFFAGEARRKVALPGYPFERQRHWVDTPSTPAAIARPVVASTGLTWEASTRWDHEVERPQAPGVAPLGSIASGLDHVADGLFHDRNPASRPGKQADFDALAAAYAVAAVRELGWEPRPGEVAPLAMLADRLGVPPKLRRFFGRMVQVLAEEGYLAPIEGGWQVVAAPPRVDARALLAETRARHPEWAGELELAGRCGEALGRVLRGAVDPLEILFPGGSAALLEGLYEDSPVARLSNRLVAEAIERAAASVPAGRTVRILELGAGTGGTTSHVLPRLPKGRCQYVFSDVSALFLGRAREKFAAYDFLEYRTLDLEGDPTASGLAPHQFDVILAANVLHATADLRRTLGGVRRLLAPSGLLVLLEGTGPQRLPDLVFGMIEGWWKFTDVEVRGSHPLLPRRRWVDLLEAEGFAEAATLPKPGDEAIEPDQAVILARGPAVVVEAADDPLKATGLGWLIFSDGEPGPALAGLLRAAGEPCSLVDGLAGLPDEEGFARLIRSTAEALGTPRLGVVHLRGLDRSGDLAEALGRGLGLLIRVDRSDGPIDRVWLATRGATVEGGCADPVQSSLWDFGRSTQGRAGRPTKLVDLDPLEGAVAWAGRLAREILRPDAEDTLAYRGDRRVAGRVAAAPAPAVAAEVGSVAATPDDGPSLGELRAAGTSLRPEMVESVLRSEVGRVLSIDPGRIAVDVPVNSLGLDSLMAIQLKNRIEVRTGVVLSIITLLEGRSIAEISGKMREEIVAGADTIVGSFKPVNGNGHDPRVDLANGRLGAAPGRSIIDQMVADLDALPESELDSLIDDLIGPEGLDDVEKVDDDDGCPY